MTALINRLDGRQKSESGVALVAVIGVMAVLVIVSVTVAVSAVSAASFSTSTRALVQSRAAADAGVDAVRASMLKGSFVCAQVSSPGATPQYSATVQYWAQGGASIACTGATGTGIPVGARITSTGTAALGGVAGASSGDVSTVGAEVAIVVTPGGATLDQAVFTEASLNLTNGTVISDSGPGVLDGNVYSNGHIDCHTDNLIEGTIYARGGLTIHNTCKALGTVWVQGDVNLSASSVNLAGSVFATGKAVLGVGHVGGSVIANGDVTMTSESSTACPSGGQGNVCGSVYSLQGNITANEGGGRVLGSMYARGNIVLGSEQPLLDVVAFGNLSSAGNKKGKPTGTIKVRGTLGEFNPTLAPAKTCGVRTGYTACAASSLVLPLPANGNPSFVVELPMFKPFGSANLGTPTSVVEVVAPARQSFPQIFSTPSALASNWSDWVKPTIPADMCSSSNQNWTPKLSALLASQPSGSKVLLNFASCPNALQLSGDTIKIRSDVAFFLPRGLSSSNGTTFQSTDGQPHNVLLIAPSDSPGVTWVDADANFPGQKKPVCSGGPDLSFTSSVNVQNNNKLFIYTPCNLGMANLATFAGQVYSGSASYSSGVNITRSLMSVPGVEIPGGGSSQASFAADITSRYDVSE